jgi:flavin-binding protein dodecin
MNNFHYHQDSLYSAAARILEGASEVQALVKDFAVGDNTNFGKVLEIGADSITFKAKDLPKTRITFNQRKMGSSEFLLTKLLKLKEETLDEASMDSLSLSDLWNKHREYTYAADQGWGGGYGSAKGGKAAAEAIYKFVSAKYDKKTAEDMQDASDNYLGYQEYVGGAEAKSAKADEEKLRKKYGIKESKMQEETLDEAYAAYKPLRKPEDLVAELQSIVDTPDSKLWDVTSVSLRLSHEDIFDRFPKIYDYVEDMWEAIMTPDGARKTKEIAKKAIEAVHKYYPIKEETEESEETLDEAINWLGDYLPTSEKSKFGGYRPTIINKQTKGLMYQSAAAYNTPQEAKDHAEDYLKQKSKGIKDPKVPLVGTYKEETEEEVTEAVDPATKRRKQLDMARVNAGAMSRDDYDKKYKLGKYSPAGSKLSGPGGLYKNLVKEVLNPDDDASVWIDDFVKSDDPRFEGKSKEERIKMALGAWYAAQKKESTEPTTEVLEEAAMTAAEKKIAQEVHDALKDGEQVGQTYGMQIRSQHNKLTSKFGKDWRKIAGIKEETLDERVRMQLVFKAADAVTALEDEEFEEFLKRLADKLERTGKKAGYKDAVNVASLLKKAYGTWKARKDTKDWKEDTKEQGEALQEAVYPLTKKALDATFNLDPDEFEEFLKELAKNLNNEGDDTGYDEWYQVADHIEKAHKIWKARDSNI